MNPMVDPTRNLVIAALGDAERGRLLRLGTEIELELGRVLIESGEAAETLYFPLNSAVSLLTVLDDGESIEVALVGREGLVPFWPLLGAQRMPWRAVAQMRGPALELPLAAVLEDCELTRALRLRAAELQGQILWLATLSIACNRFHRIEQRLARWLLMVNDRDDDDLIEVTHEFLSQMLGVRRQSVTQTLGRLESRGLIETLGQGRFRVLDRRGLEELACECYERSVPPVHQT